MRQAAELTTNGLTINNGSIILGTTNGTAAGNVTLSNLDFSRSINEQTRNNLRLAIGNKFGVKNDGTLYAYDAVIEGSITVGEHAETNLITSDTVNNLTQWQVVVVVDEISYASNTATLRAIVYHYGEEQINAVQDGITYQWFRRAKGNVSPTSTISGATDVSLVVTADMGLNASYTCQISKD